MNQYNKFNLFKYISFIVLITSEVSGSALSRKRERVAEAEEKREHTKVLEFDRGEEVFKETYDQAYHAASNGKFDQAALLYKQCLQQFTSKGGKDQKGTGADTGLQLHLYGQLGEVLAAGGELREAEEAYTQGAQLGVQLLQAKETQAQESKGQDLTFEKEEEEGDNEDEEVEDVGEEELKKRRMRSTVEHAEVHKALTNIAQIQLATDRMEDALKTFKTLRDYAQSKSEEAKVYKEIGMIYLKTNNLNAAVQALEEAVGLDPDVKKGYSNLAIAYTRLWEKDNANADFKRNALANFELAMEVEPESATLRTNYGILLAQMQDWTHAKMALLDALHIDPKNENAKKNLKMVEDIVEEYTERRPGDNAGNDPKFKPLTKRYIGPTPKIYGI
mmetsp:Transcript_22504/g.31314  ORF Transcript_22504/g.31314 Transcript_22504/m.31314 type:complete len:390 (-) Transcript_22504:55-1224(-)|eukprot:CAMPEP_0196589878 /NCGR_PEP_ID=MMETSP1081-20130531/64906_1 /TAXON_ID=36882 /ORGANISM="Pyramimonas amylifera, Strain CCMP720" /LENGTH=389 /DNA_ID=CAMNT_0041912809 /DNA_START=71 /DNA_END=1240 /DNA_ORIENTATION=+